LLKIFSPPYSIRQVATQALSSLDFSRNGRARLVPLARGILYLASCVPVDVIACNSRIGTMPVVTTIKTALKGFSDQKAVAIRTRARDTTIAITDGRETTKAILLIFDNVQHFLKQRDLRIGRDNSMIIGIAATYVQLEVKSTACDVLDKRKRIAMDLRKDVSIDQILGLIDQNHLKIVGRLQWLSALVNNIPQLSIYKEEISLRYRTRAAKLQLPIRKSEIHPLATSGKNEALISDLKDGLVDFLDQMGQKDGDYDFRLWFAGGDGMSYNNMLILKKYLQTHKDAFQRFEMMQTVLQAWHTMWTDLSCTCETHWGDALDNNPATLGWSAKKIGRAPPANLKKVDYYPTAQLLSLIHDTQMLDAWR
jgi:hypothetical protein